VTGTLRWQRALAIFLLKMTWEKIRKKSEEVLLWCLMGQLRQR
jgi:hypothetical protein